MAPATEKLLHLVDSAQEDLHRADIPLAGVIAKAMRIARLRGDIQNLLWLEMEMRPIGDTSSSREIEAQLERNLNPEEFKSLRTSILAEYFKRREIKSTGNDDEDEERICALSVGQIEVQISMLENLRHGYTPNGGRHPSDLYLENQITARNFGWVLDQIRAHTATFLSKTESQLLVGRAASDIFEETREYVDSQLQVISDKALAQLAAAYSRQEATDPEAGSHALTSCRRVLKSLADALYPPTDEVVRGGDGRERKMSDDKYISRLMQLASEAMTGSGSRSLLQAQLSDLAARLDALHAACSKGVHDDVSDFEVNQCVIQTYLLCGDMLRLQDQEASSEKLVAAPSASSTP